MDSSSTPVQWMRAFAFAPDTECSRIRNSPRPLDGSEDALPIQFRPRARSALQKGDPVKDGEGSALMVPAKPKRRRRSSQVSSRSTDALSVASTAETRSQMLSASVMEENDHNHNRPVSSRSRASLRRLRSGRVVLNSAEKNSPTDIPNVETLFDGCPSASLHYPSSPASLASPHSITDTEKRDGTDPELPLKVSKYFLPPSTPPARPALECIPAVTHRRSPPLVIPGYIKSASPHASSSKENHYLRESRPIPLWHNNPELFSDLMVMLRRLKPILIQESVQDDPWKVLIASRLLNVTTGKAAIPVFCKIISRWPTPHDLVHAPQDELVELLRPLGLYNKRANWLKDISKHVLEDQRCPETSLAHLLSAGCIVPALPLPHCTGVGTYALDALWIFCAKTKDAWKHVMPRDKVLVRYSRWRWAVEEGKMWYPEVGVVGDVNVPYLITLVDELASHYDNAIGGEGTKYPVALDVWKLLLLGVP